MNEIAKTILEQLGGNRFCAMTGAKDFCQGSNMLQFRIGRGATKGINLVKITLETSDTYIVEFYKVRQFDAVRVAFETGIYADNLQATFTAATGFDTHL